MPSFDEGTVPPLLTLTQSFNPVEGLVVEACPKVFVGHAWRSFQKRLRFLKTVFCAKKAVFCVQKREWPSLWLTQAGPFSKREGALLTSKTQASTTAFQATFVGTPKQFAETYSFTLPVPL